MKLVFIATGDIALPTFRHLIVGGPKPCLLITQPDKPVGRSHSELAPPRVKTLALEHGIPVWQPEKIGHVADELHTLSPDLIVVMAYGQILGKAVRNSAKTAIINLHASLLPRYRGASCIQSAIANGDAETGITIMRVIRELDAGDILCAKRIPLSPDETGGTLHDRLAEIGPAVLDQALAILKSDPNAGIPQDPALASHAPKLLRDDGRLDLTKPAAELERIIRAYDPWPGTFAEIPIKNKTKRLKIFPPVLIDPAPLPHGQLTLMEGRLHLGCGTGSLILSDVQPDGSRRMAARQFANSL